jgi:hypothetical protein
MPHKFSALTISGVEVFLEGIEDFDGLREGLHLLIWAYLQLNIDEGLDGLISGQFLRDFDSLMEMILFLQEHAENTD